MNEPTLMQGSGVSNGLTKNEPSEIELILSRFDSKLGQLEKSIAYAKEVFRSLDVVANKLNPDAFHKNQPQPVIDGLQGGENSMNKVPSSTKSGAILTLTMIIQNVENQTQDLDIFIRDEARQTVEFFKNQI